eukprot:TRINITY_DN111747_c0_g1_i1.p1 TRINITY_DN111747_c0_g1~~TRINITY_DN111747_c0_g1_i1.p1  ORF type:complete len:1389 (+),score=237.61 TRINITY_DN111747_c0_g1_i1:209-4375(+)
MEDDTLPTAAALTTTLALAAATADVLASESAAASEGTRRSSLQVPEVSQKSERRHDHESALAAKSNSDSSMEAAFVAAYAAKCYVTDIVLACILRIGTLPSQAGSENTSLLVDKRPMEQQARGQEAAPSATGGPVSDPPSITFPEYAYCRLTQLEAPKLIKVDDSLEDMDQDISIEDEACEVLAPEDARSLRSLQQAVLATATLLCVAVDSFLGHRRGAVLVNKDDSAMVSQASGESTSPSGSPRKRSKSCGDEDIKRLGRSPSKSRPHDAHEPFGTRRSSGAAGSRPGSPLAMPVPPVPLRKRGISINLMPDCLGDQPVSDLAGEGGADDDGLANSAMLAAMELIKEQRQREQEEREAEERAREEQERQEQEEAEAEAAAQAAEEEALAHAAYMHRVGSATQLLVEATSKAQLVWSVTGGSLAEFAGCNMEADIPPQSIESLFGMPELQILAALQSQVDLAPRSLQDQFDACQVQAAYYSQSVGGMDAAFGAAMPFAGAAAAAGAFWPQSPDAHAGYDLAAMHAHAAAASGSAVAAGTAAAPYGWSMPAGAQYSAPAYDARSMAMQHYGTPWHGSAADGSYYPNMMRQTSLTHSSLEERSSLPNLQGAQETGSSNRAGYGESPQKEKHQAADDRMNGAAADPQAAGTTAGSLHESEQPGQTLSVSANSRQLSSMLVRLPPTSYSARGGHRSRQVVGGSSQLLQSIRATQGLTSRQESEDCLPFTPALSRTGTAGSPGKPGANGSKLPPLPSSAVANGKASEDILIYQREAFVTPSEGGGHADDGILTSQASADGLEAGWPPGSPSVSATLLAGLRPPSHGRRGGLGSSRSRRKAPQHYPQAPGTAPPSARRPVPQGLRHQFLSPNDSAGSILLTGGEYGNETLQSHASAASFLSGGSSQARLRPFTSPQSELDPLQPRRITKQEKVRKMREKNWDSSFVTARTTTKKDDYLSDFWPSGVAHSASSQFGSSRGFGAGFGESSLAYNLGVGAGRAVEEVAGVIVGSPSKPTFHTRPLVDAQGGAYVVKAGARSQRTLCRSLLDYQDRKVDKGRRGVEWFESSLHIAYLQHEEMLRAQHGSAEVSKLDFANALLTLLVEQSHPALRERVRAALPSGPQREELCKQASAELRDLASPLADEVQLALDTLLGATPAARQEEQDVSAVGESDQQDDEEDEPAGRSIAQSLALRKQLACVSAALTYRDTSLSIIHGMVQFERTHSELRDQVEWPGDGLTSGDDLQAADLRGLQLGRIGSAILQGVGMWQKRFQQVLTSGVDNGGSVEVDQSDVPAAVFMWRGLDVLERLESDVAVAGLPALSLPSSASGLLPRSWPTLQMTPDTETGPSRCAGRAALHCTRGLRAMLRSGSIKQGLSRAPSSSAGMSTRPGTRA